jgi:diaminohydroxyphosphoribosylaminopyrimidine deaminase / 5-amino-6-(5-phosphoribosylamino)uracil reductase
LEFVTDTSKHEKFMHLAYECASKGWGKTHPNPVVGAVIVESDEVVADGAHLKAGGPHAERAALEKLGRKPKDGAVLYVTLEPCSTTGRTPPCTELILIPVLKKSSLVREIRTLSIMGVQPLFWKRQG